MPAEADEHEFFPKQIHVEHQREDVILPARNVWVEIEQEHFGDFHHFSVRLRFSVPAQFGERRRAHFEVGHFRKMERKRADAALQRGVCIDLPQELERFPDDFVEIMLDIVGGVADKKPLLVHQILLDMPSKQDIAFERGRVSLRFSVFFDQALVQKAFGFGEENLKIKFEDAVRFEPQVAFARLPDVENADRAEHGDEFSAPNQIAAARFVGFWKHFDGQISDLNHADVFAKTNAPVYQRKIGTAIFFMIGLQGHQFWVIMFMEFERIVLENSNGLAGVAHFLLFQEGVQSGFKLGSIHF